MNLKIAVYGEIGTGSFNRVGIAPRVKKSQATFSDRLEMNNSDCRAMTRGAMPTQLNEDCVTALPFGPEGVVPIALRDAPL